MLNRVNELDKKLTTVKNDLNIERTQRTGADYSIGMRFDTLIHYLQEGKTPGFHQKDRYNYNI